MVVGRGIIEAINSEFPFIAGWASKRQDSKSSLCKFRKSFIFPTAPFAFPRSTFDFSWIEILSRSSVNIRWNILLTATTVNWTPLIVRFPIHEVNAEKRVRITNSRDYSRRNKRNEIEFIRWSKKEK